MLPVVIANRLANKPHKLPIAVLIIPRGILHLVADPQLSRNPNSNFEILESQFSELSRNASSEEPVPQHQRSEAAV